MSVFSQDSLLLRDSIEIDGRLRIVHSRTHPYLGKEKTASKKVSVINQL